MSEFHPGDRVTYLYTPGSPTVEIPVPGVVVRLTPKRVCIRVHTIAGQDVERNVSPSKLRLAASPHAVRLTLTIDPPASWSIDESFAIVGTLERALADGVRFTSKDDSLLETTTAILGEIIVSGTVRLELAIRPQRSP